ncbi:alpha/beta fold hydrolase [Gordonia sp. NPDC003504]
MQDLTTVRQPPGKFFEIAGRRIHVVDQGVGDPVLLMAALGSNWFDLDAIAWRLRARSRRVIRYDRPGYGFSEEPAPGHVPTLADEIERMRAVLDAVGVTEPVVVVGHSLASLYVEGFARAHPDRIAAVVMLDGSFVLLPWRLVPTAFRVANAHRLIAVVREVARRTDLRLHGRALLRARLLPQPPEGFGDAEQAWAEQLFGGTSMLLATLVENAAFPAINEALRQIRKVAEIPPVPVVVVVALSGPSVWQRVWRWKQQRYARMLGGSIRALRSRHFIVLDQPEALARIIDEVRALPRPFGGPTGPKN